MQRFGEKIRSLRTKRALSQRMLARELGFSHVHLHHLEVGEKTPNADVIKRFARFFGVTTDYLMWDEIEIDLDEQGTNEG